MRKLIFYIFIFLGCSFYAFANQQTFVTDYDVLSSNKTKIENGDKVLNRAKSELIKDANRIVRVGEIYTVVNKKQLPPSQSRNDYYSLAPYWWPDANKIDKQPYVRKDGKVNPESKEVTDSYMLGSLSNDVYTLGLAYFYTDDEKYAKWINKLIAVFFIDPETRMNPNLNYAQVIKGRNNRGSITIEAASFIKLIEGLQFAQNSSALNRHYISGIKKWFGEFAFWMESEERPRRDMYANNNIGVYYAAQIIVYSLFVGNEAKGKKFLEEHGRRIVDNQIDGEGRLEAELQRSIPWSYTKYGMAAFDYLVQLSFNLGVDLYSYENPKRGSIDKMYKWLISYAEKEKSWEYDKETPSLNQLQTVLLRSNVVGYKNKITHKEKKVSYLYLLTKTFD